MNKIFHLLIPLAAYFVMGKFGLLLSIPPGFASAVWPASGIALACLLLLNPTLATLGVGLGSFLTNHLIVIDGHIGFSDSSAIVPAGIAIGAMLQAQAAYYLFRLCNDSSPSLNSPKDIYRFTLIVAPLSCILSASAGVMALYFNGIISIENSIFNWATWWVGDTIGVLLFAPLMLHIFANKNLSRERKTHIILPTLVIFIGILLLFMNSVDARKNHLQNVINDDAKRFYQLIEEHLVISKNKLYAYAASIKAPAMFPCKSFMHFLKPY